RVGTVAGGGSDRARNLFGWLEIMFSRLADRRSFERYDPLIALARRCMIEGNCKEALAEKTEQRRLGPRLGEAIGIEFQIAAKLAAAIVAHEQFDRPAARLRLERELARFVLER